MGVPLVIPIDEMIISLNKDDFATAEAAFERVSDWINHECPSIPNFHKPQLVASAYARITEDWNHTVGELSLVMNSTLTALGSYLH